MSIALMTNVWEKSRLGGTELLLMLAIADFANDSGVAFPSVPTLARKIRMSKRNTHYLLSKLEQSGELAVQRNKGPHGCNLYTVQILHGAIPAPVQLIALGGAMGSAQVVQPVAHEPLGIINKPSKRRTTNAPREKKIEVTLLERIAYCAANGLDVIPADSAAMTYMADAGIPDDFVLLAWGAFRRKYCESQPNKVYADWALAFNNAIKGDWLKLWRYDERAQQYVLTNAGVQEQRVQAAEAARHG